MAKRSKQNALTIVHYWVCATESFESEQFETKKEALADARKHLSEPGHEDHEVRIVTEQSSSQLLK